MIKKIQLYIKYKILRYKAAQLTIDDLSIEESRILNFVKTLMRSSNSIIITGEIITASLDAVELTLQNGRLIVIDPKENSYMDVKVGEVVTRALLEYASRVIRYRSALFTKCCHEQISHLLDGFENKKLDNVLV